MHAPSAQSTSPFDAALKAVSSGAASPEEAATKLASLLTESEKLWLLDGDLERRQLFKLPSMIKTGPISAGAIPRLGVPGIRFTDGPRGVVSGRATSFPVTMARAATWDPDLEEQVGLAMGRESRAQGANYSGAVCINLLRHPGWGRAQECYGEDPVLVGQMGAALTLGLRRNVMACMKHFALNSMENMRFVVNVQVDEQSLHEVYLPHFKTVVDAGVDSVMSAYNFVNGSCAGDSKVLLTDILRDEWGFQGFVTSDWIWGLRDPIRSLEAGLDVEMPMRLMRARALPDALATQQISNATVMRSVHRILATQLRHAAQKDPESPAVGTLACESHRQLARKVAQRAAVLLKNDSVLGAPVLPISAATVRRIAVIGALADAPNLGDNGSSLVNPPSTSSVLSGLREALTGAEIRHSVGSDVAEAASVAEAADIAVVVVGLTADDEGERVVNEAGGLDVFGFPFTLKIVQRVLLTASKLMSQFSRGGDRAELTLRGSDEELIKAVSKANRKTIVIVIGGSAITMERWRTEVPAILMAWYPGMEGGRAIADILTGAADPSGRLPFTIPTSADHLPFFDPDAKSIVYDSWWGQRQLRRDGHSAAFPFGFGLSYTSFEQELLSHCAQGREGSAVVRVRNTGDRKGATVLQIYAADASRERCVPQLLGFHRVELLPGEEAQSTVSLDLTPAHTRNPESKNWSRRSGDWRISVASAYPEGAFDGRALWATDSN